LATVSQNGMNRRKTIDKRQHSTRRGTSLSPTFSASAYSHTEHSPVNMGVPYRGKRTQYAAVHLRSAFPTSHLHSAIIRPKRPRVRGRTSTHHNHLICLRAGRTGTPFSSGGCPFMRRVRGATMCYGRKMGGVAGEAPFSRCNLSFV